MPPWLLAGIVGGGFALLNGLALATLKRRGDALERQTAEFADIKDLLVRLQHQVQGFGGQNGLANDVKTLVEWREEFRVGLGALLREVKHDAIAATSASYTRLEDRVYQLEHPQRRGR